MKTPAWKLPVFAIALVSAVSCASAGESLDVPGYRPECARADAFLQKLETARIAVLPVVARTREGTIFSGPAQESAVAFLREHKLGKPEARETEPDLGEPEGQFQFALFNSDADKLGKIVAKLGDADYFLTIEHLITPVPDGGLATGGLHIYVLDADGENAFSFLLNSHHKALTEARLRTANASKESRDELVLKGTRVALEALRQQVDAARKP